MTLTILSIIAFPLFTITSSVAGEVPSENQKQMVLMFLEKVAGINVSVYSLSFTYTDNGGIPIKDWSLIVFLTNGMESTRVLFDVKQNMVWHYKCDGKPLRIRQGEDTLRIAKNTLEAFISDFNASSCFELVQLLNEAIPNQNQIIREGNLTLEISDDGLDFLWYYQVNGLKIPFKILDLEISSDGYLTRFFNGWSIYSIEPTGISVSKQQAIDIAFLYAQEYANTHGRTITDVNATTRYTNDKAGLRDGQYTIYPEWYVSISFAKSDNEQSIYGYGVLLWADNGQVYSHGPEGFSSSQREVAADQPNSLMYGSSMAVILTLALPVLFFAYRKRCSKRKGQ